MRSKAWRLKPVATARLSSTVVHRSRATASSHHSRDTVSSLNKDTANSPNKGTVNSHRSTEASSSLKAATLARTLSTEGHLRVERLRREVDTQGRVSRVAGTVVRHQGTSGRLDVT